MIFFVLYALGIWTIAWRCRRRWQAFGALIASVPPVILSAHLDMWIVRTIFDEDAGWILTLAILFAGVIVFIGLLLALQPRPKPAHACVVCEYDLRGIGARTCPECGAELSDDEPKRRRQRPQPPTAPTESLASQLADKRRDRSRESSQLSRVTTIAPPATDAPTTSQ